MRPIPAITAPFIEGAEALRLVAYRDSRGVATIGYGHTGLAVVMGQTITKAQADAYLASDLQTAGSRLAGVVTAAAINRLDDHEYAALISFVFNLGANPGWNIWKVVNAGKLDNVPAEMAQFDKEHLNGRLVTVPGLINRRMAEIALWKTPDASSAAAIATPDITPPSSYTVRANTPPTPDATAKPLVQSKTIWTAAAVGAGTLVQAGTYIKAAAEPLAANSHLIMQSVEYASVAIFAGTILIGVFRYMDERAKHQ